MDFVVKTGCVGCLLFISVKRNKNPETIRRRNKNEGEWLPDTKKIYFSFLS